MGGSTLGMDSGQKCKGDVKYLSYNELFVGAGRNPTSGSQAAYIT